MQKRFRLRHTKDFQRIRQEGRTIKHPLVILNIAPQDTAHNRYGFITSKRLGKAVERNRTRRLMREAIRSLHPHLRQGYDLVLIARSRSVGQPLGAIQSAIQDVCQRAGLLIPDQ